MTRAVLIDDREEMAASMALNLKVYLAIDVICRKDLDSGIKVLEALPNVDLFIIRSTDQNQPQVLLAKQTLDKLNFKAPLLLNGTPLASDMSNVFSVEADKRAEYLVASVAKILGLKPKEIESECFSDMVELKIGYLKFLRESPCDIFVKLEETSEEYSILFDQETSEAKMKATIRDHINKGIKKFYIKKDDRLEFAKLFSSQILATFEDKEASPEKKVRAADQAMNFVSEQIKIDGLSPGTEVVAKTVIKSMLKYAKQNIGKKVLSLVASMIKAKASYRFLHVQLITLLAAHAISKLDWGAKEHTEKLGYVAFFHDILLTTDEMCKVHTQEQFNEADLTEQEKNIVINHALYTLEILQKYPQSFMGAGVLIKQHHGATSGIGFVNDYSLNLSPLAIVFIVCEHYAHELIENHENGIGHREIAQKLISRFDKSKYRRVLETFANLKF